MRENALELKLCKISTIGIQSENQTLPNISLGSPKRLWRLGASRYFNAFYKAYKNFQWSIGNQIDAFECFSQSK
ncbi:hypothetical protein NP05227_00300 [Helicobacter pylori]